MKGREEDGEKCFEEPWEVEGKLSLQLNANKQTLQRIVQNWQFHNHIIPEHLELTTTEQRCIGSFIAMASCNAFIYGLYNFQEEFKCRSTKKNLTQVVDQMEKQKISFSFGLSVSLSLCIAYSLILIASQFNPKHIRYLYQLWYHRQLPKTCPNHQFGIGWTIKKSILSFHQTPTDYVEYNSGQQNGSGTIVRVAPIVIAYHKNKSKALQFAKLQSLTTHDGIEAKQCCRLLASIIFQLINRDDQDNWRQTIDKACQTFQTTCQEVQCLAISQKQTEQIYHKKCGLGNNFEYENQSIQDRNWNWRSKEFTYSKTRLKNNKQGIGAYCMDGLAMALHSVWHTNSFVECLMFNVNVDGDYNIVASIAGQIAGAIYGTNKQILELYCKTEDVKLSNYQALLVPLQLINKELRFQPQTQKQLCKISQTTKSQIHLQDPMLDLPSSEDKLITQTQISQQINYIYNQRILQLIQQLKHHKLLSCELDIYEGKTVVIKKLILNEYWKKYHQNGYHNAFHGTQINNFTSIIINGFKKIGQKVGDKVIQIAVGHIQGNIEHEGIQNYPRAIFSTPSVFYASHQAYTKEHFYLINTKTQMPTGWRAILQVKVKINTYTKHPTTTYHDFDVHDQPEQVEFRTQNNGNRQIIVVAIVLISKTFLKEQQQKLPGYYQYLTEMVLNSKEQIKMKATKYSSNVL